MTMPVILWILVKRDKEKSVNKESLGVGDKLKTGLIIFLADCLPK